MNKRYPLAAARAGMMAPNSRGFAGDLSTHRLMSRTLLLATGACLIGQAAFAHAFLERATAAANSDLPVAPAAVTITFTEGVEPSFSTIEVRDSHGLRVDNADMHPAGRRQLSDSLSKLPAGKYTVTWRVTSIDTHRSEGRFSFRVSP